jgi:hypothetical protein
MATRQQQIQQERQRQQKEAAARRQLPDRPLGAEALDAIEQDVATFVQLPGVRQALNFAAGAVNMVNEAVLEPARYAATDPSQAGTPMALAGTALTFGEGLMEKSAEGGAILAEKMGVDPRIGGFVGGTAAETLLTAGLGAAGRKITQAVDMLPPGGPMPQVAMAGGAPILTPIPPQLNVKGGNVFLSTTSPEWTSPKAGLGSAVSEQFAPAVETYKRRRTIYSEVKSDLKAAYESGEINAERLKKALMKIGKHEKGVMSTFPYDETNPEAYLTDLRVAQPYRQERAGQRGVLGELEERFGRVDPYDVTKQAQQHHVLAKAETKPFADTLLDLIDRGIGDDDDLVNFFVWPEKYDLYPGNVVKNLLDMGEITHTTAKQDPMALHKILDMAGLEFGSQTKPQIIKRYGLDKVKSVDELMQAYDRYLQEIAVPSRDIAYKVQDWWYNKTIKTLKGKELKEFKERFAALQDPRRSL